MPRVSSKTREWEKERRIRLNEAFATLCKLLPNYDPAINQSKIDVLRHAASYIEELQNKIKELVTTNDENSAKIVKGDEIKKLQERIKRLLGKNEQMCTLLREAKITIPPGCKFVRKYQSYYQWSNKFPQDQVKKIQKKEQEKENVASNKKVQNKNFPNKKAKTGTSNATPKHRKAILNRPETKKLKTKKKKSNKQVLTSKCMIVLSQSSISQPCYVITNAPSNNLFGSAPTVITNSNLLTNPVVSSKSTVKTTVPPLGPGTLILANGTIVPILPQQPVLPQIITQPLPRPPNPTVILLPSNPVKVQSSVNSTKVSSSSVKTSVRIKPKYCLTLTTQVNKVPIPALTSRYANNDLVLKKSEPKITKNKVTEKKTSPDKENDKKKTEVTEVGKKRKLESNDKEDKQEEAKKTKVDESGENDESPTPDKRDESCESNDKAEVTVPEKLPEITEETPPPQPQPEVAESSVNPVIETTQNAAKEVEDVEPTPEKPPEIKKSEEPVPQEMNDLNINHSELSNDIFASLQVPTGCQNPESTSPTAAFLLAFPLVSSLTGVKVTEVTEEDNPESQRGTPTLLQIGTMDSTKPTQTDNLTPSLLNLDNLSFFSSKDLCGGFYNSFDNNLGTSNNTARTTTSATEKNSTKSDLAACLENINALNQVTSYHMKAKSDVKILENKVLCTSYNDVPKNNFIDNSFGAKTCSYNLPKLSTSSSYDLSKPSTPYSYELPKLNSTRSYDLPKVSKTCSYNLPKTTSTCSYNMSKVGGNGSCELPKTGTTSVSYELPKAPTNISYEIPKVIVTSASYEPTKTGTTGQTYNLSKVSTSSLTYELPKSNSTVPVASTYELPKVGISGPVYELPKINTSSTSFELPKVGNTCPTYQLSKPRTANSYELSRTGSYEPSGTSYELSKISTTGSYELSKVGISGSYELPKVTANSSYGLSKCTNSYETPKVITSVPGTTLSYEVPKAGNTGSYDLGKVTTTYCYTTTIKSYPDPLYTNSNSYNYNYPSETNLNQNYYKNIAKNDNNRSYYSLNYENYSDYRKNDSNFTNYYPNYPKSKTKNSKTPVNWMTTPDNRLQVPTDSFLPQFTKESDFTHNSIYPSNSFTNTQTYFNTNPIYNESNNQEKGKNLDLPLVPPPVNTYQRNEVEDNQFSWSPTKMPQFLDPPHNFVSSTLPTLVGDLALGGNPLSFTEQKLEQKCQKKESTNTSRRLKNYENNFLSVSQLVDHNKNESVPARTTTRRNSGNRSSKKGPQTKSSQRPKSEAKDLQNYKVENKAIKQVGVYNNNVQGSNDIFCDPAKNRNVSKNSSYSAEALIGHQMQNEQKNQKISVPPFLPENIIPYFPPVDLQQDNNYMQQNQNYQATSFGHNFPSTFQNNTYTPNTFIPSATTTTYLTTNNFIHDVPDYSDNLFNKEKNCNNKNLNRNTTRDQQCALSGTTPKKKKKHSNETNIPGFVDFSFLSMSGSINSPILPDDFHTHSGFLQPPTPQLYPCKNPFNKNDLSSTSLLPLPPVPVSTRSNIQHPDISPSVNNVGGTSSLTNFNLSTIFPEINNKSIMPDPYLEPRIKEHPKSYTSSVQVPFNDKPTLSFSCINSTISQTYNNQ